MTTFKKNTLAVALVAAMGFAANASAFSVTTSGDTSPELIATQAGTSVTMTEVVEINTALGDNIIGRTTGFQVRLTLKDGAEFATALAPVIGNAYSGGWTASLIAGGQPGDTVAQIAVNPSAPGSSVGIGYILTPFTLDLQNVSAVFGAQTHLQVELVDPVGGTTLPNAGGQTFDLTPTIIERDDGVSFTCAEEATPNKIDVGSNTLYGTKTGFVASPWTIGDASTDLASLGTITVATTAGYTFDIGPGGDSLYSVVTGVDMSSFDDVFLATDSTCATNIGSYSINYTTNTATLDTEFDAINTAGGTFSTTGGTANLCVDVDGQSSALGSQATVAAQSFTVVNGINGVAETHEDPCVVSGIAYNGSVVKVETFNPAGNTTQQSFLRVTNPSSVDGLVTIEAVDDSGTAAASPVTFTLGAGQSMQLNSDTLENGGSAITGAFGDGAGKWRLLVTGEFYGMRVASLNRNNTTGTVTNLTDYDTNNEQQNAQPLGIPNGSDY